MTSSSTAEPNLQQALDRVMKMMAIEGPSTREGQIVRFIEQALRKAHVPASAIHIDKVHQRSEFGGEVGNLIVKLPGTQRAPRRMLLGHVDTVPICVGSKPRRKGDAVRSADPNTGLGADNRSGAAVVLTTLIEILKQRLPHPPLTFFFPVQEEIGLIGARLVSLAALGRPKMAFNFDANVPEKIYIGATGSYRLAIDVKGIPSHAGSHPRGGVNAITITGLAIAELERTGYLGAIRKRHAGRMRLATSNLGTIEGGSAVNVVAPHARINAGVRSHDPTFRKHVVDQFVKAFERAAKRMRNDNDQAGEVNIDARVSYEAFRLDETDAVVTHAAAAVRSLGLEPHYDISNGGLDANYLTNRGIPTVTLGAGQSGAHTTGETLTVSHFEQGCRLALRLATGANPDG